MPNSLFRILGAGDDAGGSRWTLWLFFLFLALCFLGGGGSRADIPSLLYVRPAAIACAAIFLLFAPRIEFRAVKVPLLLLAALALIMLLQLVPLPPEIWTGLPGRAPFVDAASVADIAQPWRPISIAPDLTLNSLASLVVPFAALIGFAALSPQQRTGLLGFLMVAVAASALVGILQLAGGESSAFYLYRITNNGSAVGLFSNRNHQAALLALCYPMLAAWAAAPGMNPQVRRFRTMMGIVFGLLLVLLILITGSRGGLLLAAAALPIAGILYLGLNESRQRHGGLARKLAYLTFGALAVGALVVFLASSRAVALQRLFHLQIDSDMRVSNLPVIARIAQDFFPIGSGFGTFDPIYRVHEPLETLSPEYLNQAHNDLLELALTGGLPALLVLGAFLLWFAIRTIAAHRRHGPGRDARLMRLGAAMILLLLIGSLMDYPLRTPIMAALFAIACGWLSAGGDAVKRR